MNLENWMYRRDREEYILSFPNIDVALHRSKQEEAEQEIEMELSGAERSLGRYARREQAELQRQKAERLAEERAEEEYHEKRYAEKMKGAV